MENLTLTINNFKIYRISVNLIGESLAQNVFLLGDKKNDSYHFIDSNFVPICDHSYTFTELYDHLTNFNESGHICKKCIDQNIGIRLTLRDPNFEFLFKYIGDNLVTVLYSILLVKYLDSVSDQYKNTNTIYIHAINKTNDLNNILIDEMKFFIIEAYRKKEEASIILEKNLEAGEKKYKEKLEELEKITKKEIREKEIDKHKLDYDIKVKDWKNEFNDSLMGRFYNFFEGPYKNLTIDAKFSSYINYVYINYKTNPESKIKTLWDNHIITYKDYFRISLNHFIDSYTFTKGLEALMDKVYYSGKFKTIKITYDDEPTISEHLSTSISSLITVLKRFIYYYYFGKFDEENFAQKIDSEESYPNYLLQVAKTIKKGYFKKKDEDIFKTYLKLYDKINDIRIIIIKFITKINVDGVKDLKENTLFIEDIINKNINAQSITGFISSSEKEQKTERKKKASYIIDISKIKNKDLQDLYNLFIDAGKHIDKNLFTRYPIMPDK